GQARAHVARLYPDGSAEVTFNPAPDSFVNSLAVQPDGKVLVGGSFTNLGGISRQHLGRLNAGGSVDLGFNPGANNIVYATAVQADGKIVVGGNFTLLGGQARLRLGRLNTNGSLDGGFNAPAEGNSEFSPPLVYCLAVQQDGKILVGGSFTNLAGQPRRNLGRLNADGTLDTGFNPGANQWV